MDKILRFTTVLLIVAVTIISGSSKSHAIPAFARQTGIACSGCHFQHFPTLNAFGRAFKSNGYTMTGGQTTLVEDSGLSLPTVLNATFVTKARYFKENGTKLDKDGNKSVQDTGRFDFPDEAAILLGGRAGEYIGFLVEAQLADNTKMGLANFKMPIGFSVGDGSFEVIPFKTDALGPQAAFELLATGAVDNSRVFEDQKRVMSAQRYIGASSPASGVALVYAHNLGFVNATLWTPYDGTSAVKSWNQYFRAAVTPTVGAWDLAAGAQYWTGTSETNLPAQKQDTKAYVVDAQAQGAIGSLPLGVYLSYGNAGATTTGSTANLFNGNPNDRKATSVAAELGVLPRRFTVGLGYRIGDNGAATNSGDNALVIGAIYNLAQNIQIGVNQTFMSGDANKSPNADQQTMLNIFAAF